METLTLKQQVENSKYVYIGFNPAGEEIQDNTPKDPLVLSVSNDAINWTKIKEYSDIYLRDADMVKIDGYYWIIGTLKLFRTLDFVNFDSYPLEDTLNTASNGKYHNIWAPEFVQDHADNSWHIVYSANDGNRGIYFADFDPNTGAVTNCFQECDVDCQNSIDPNINYIDGTYYLWLSSARLFTSDTLKGHYTSMPTDIIEDKTAKWYEAPEMLIVGDYAFFYQDKIDSHVSGVADSGYMVVRIARKNNLSHWGDEQTVNSSINMRHGSFMYNEQIYTQYPSYTSTPKNVNKILTVQAINRKEVEPLSCILFQSLNIQWQVNSTYQLQFTAFDDGSLSYELLNNESTIIFNGQKFIIKTCEPDYSVGFDSKAITATHIYNEIGRVRQYDVKSGTLTYSPRDVLSFYLDKNPDNVLGFTYSIYGEFEKQQIENLGSSSGKDMLSKILEQWPSAIIYPNNTDIGIYTPQAFYKNFGNRIDYLHDTQEIKITIDSTSIVNQVKCYGKQLENNDDNSVTKYYFDPFIATDYESVGNWGPHIGDDINDERFTDKSSMEKYALSQMTTDPIVSIEVTCDQNETPIAGETRRLEIKHKSFVSNVNVVGYTWYPFDESQNTELEFDNLPISILNSNSSINTRIRSIQQMAQQAMNKAMTSTTNYVSYTDPAKQESNSVRTGDLWTRPLVTGGDSE